MSRVAVLVVAALACGALAGCGPGRTRVDVVLLVDCSKSTAPFRARWLAQIQRHAAQALDEGSAVYADCVDGAPQISIRFIPVGTDVPKAYRSNPNLVERYHVAGAAALVQSLGQRMERQPRHRGSALLEGLEVAADLKPRKIEYWTDGLLIEVGQHIDVNHGVTSEQRAELVRTWQPRLRSLSSVPVTVYGLGSGARTSTIVRRARSLIDAVTAASGIPLVWSRDTE